jgi:N-acetylneuraminic acid mutarotase
MITPVVASAHSWQMLTPLPAPNGGFISGEVDGKIVVLGGTNWEGGKKNWLNTVYQFDPATSAWSTLEPLTTPLAYGIGANVNGVFVVVGGTTGLEPWRGVVRVGNGRLTSSAEGGPSMPAVLSAGGAIAGELIVAGGTDDAANVKGLSRAAAALDLKTGRTRVLPEFPGLGFGTAACVAVGGELFIFAGANWNVSANKVKNSVEAWAFSAARGAWRHLKPYPISARGVTAVALDEHRIYLAGGFVTEDFTDHAFIYNIVTDSYTPAAVLPYKGQVGLVRCGEYVYCIGGEDRMKHRSDAVFRIKGTDLAP